MQAKQRLTIVEYVALGVAAGVVLICTVSNSPFSGLSVHMQELNQRQRNKILVRELSGMLNTLRAENASLEDDLARAGRMLESKCDELAALQQQQELLNARVTETAAELRDTEGLLETASAERNRLTELLDLQKATEERDEATTRAEKAEERIRQLTLELHRAGVWP
jgi:hypothetical protein